MPKAKKITSPFDIMERDGYKEIVELLHTENQPLTVTEIRDKLFPVGSQNEKKPQTVQVFLKYLVDTGLVVKNTGSKFNNIRTTYEAVPEDVFWELRGDELRKKMTNTKQRLLFHLDKLNQDLIKWNSDDNWPLTDTPGTASKLIMIRSNCKFDAAIGKTIFDCEKILNGFYTPKEAVPSIQDFFEYKLEPVKKELENYLTMNSKDSKIKITVEYEDGEKVVIS